MSEKNLLEIAKTLETVTENVVRIADAVRERDVRQGFDRGFLGMISRLAEDLGVPEHIAIQNLVLKQLAHREAVVEVYGQGDDPGGFMQQTDGSWITCLEYFLWEKDSEIKRLEGEKRERLRWNVSQYGDNAIPPEDREWLRQQETADK